MFKNRSMRGLISLALALAAALASPTLAANQDGPASAETGQRDEVLVLGRVSNNPRKDYPGLKALADYLATKLGDTSIREGSVQFAGDNDEMVKLLREGGVDVTFDTVFPALTYEREAGANLVLREWRDGAPTYRRVLFKRKDNPIAGLPDLVGRTLAFERPGSTTAYFVPKAELVAAGLRLTELKAPKQPPLPGTVGYVFAGSENNLVVWVHRGLVEVGAFSDIDWEQSEDMPAELKEDFEIFYRSAPLPRALVITRPGLSPRVVSRIRQVLLDSATDPSGAEMLKAKKVAKYDELIGEAADGIEAARRLATVTD
jgi:phosphonate transport system substrate-binding protein